MLQSNILWTTLFTILFAPCAPLFEKDCLVDPNWNAFSLTDNEEKETLFHHLNNQENIVIHVSESLRSILKDSKNDTITNGSIDIIVNDKTYSYKSKIECGGKTRRRICKTPPLKLNFKKKALKKDDFEKSCDKMKLVFQCENNSRMANSILCEKLIYDLYGITSPYHFKAFQAKVKIGNDDKTLQTIVLEDEKDVMRRTKTAVLKNRTIGTNAMERKYYVRMCLFQFMIGNTDWSARKGHNTQLFRRLEDNALIIVPYDFDYSGIINNHYALSPEQLPINNVTTRYFMDKSISRDELDPAIEDFMQWKTEITETVSQADYLSNSAQKSMSKYIDGFYDIISNEKKIKKMLKK